MAISLSVLAVLWREIGLEPVSYSMASKRWGQWFWNYKCRYISTFDYRWEIFIYFFRMVEGPEMRIQSLKQAFQSNFTKKYFLGTLLIYLNDVYLCFLWAFTNWLYQEL